jgi:hypothetical protein
VFSDAGEARVRCQGPVKKLNAARPLPLYQFWPAPTTPTACHDVPRFSAELHLRARVGAEACACSQTTKIAAGSSVTC